MQAKAAINLILGLSLWLLFFVLNSGGGKVIYYLNMGFILEQALVDIVKRYFDRQQFDSYYGNFHISVTNEHPFAKMIYNTNERAGDNFPAIVITTQSDSKPADLVNMPPQFHGVGYSSDDFDEFYSMTKRKKTRIDENGEVIPVKKKGQDVYENIPGFVFALNESSINKLKEIADSRTVGEEPGYVYGLKVDTRRRDRISFEIWCENNQLKNELYEHLRILLTSTMNDCLHELYSFFDPSIFDSSVSGERSNNVNYEFDCVLWGSHITCEVDYNVSQIILDTEINNLSKELIWEVINHVKN